MLPLGTARGRHSYLAVTPGTSSSETVVRGRGSPSNTTVPAHAATHPKIEPMGSDRYKPLQIGGIGWRMRHWAETVPHHY